MSNIKQIFEIIMTQTFGRETPCNTVMLFERQYGFSVAANNVIKYVCDISARILTQYIQHLSVCMSIVGINVNYLQQFMKTKPLTFYSSVASWGEINDDKEYMMSLWYTLSQQYQYAVNMFLNSLQCGLLKGQYYYSVDNCVYDFIPYYYNAMCIEKDINVRCKVNYARNGCKAVVNDDMRFVGSCVPMRIFQDSTCDEYESNIEGSVYVNFPGDEVMVPGVLPLCGSCVCVQVEKEFEAAPYLVATKKHKVLEFDSGYVAQKKTIVSVVVECAPVTLNAESHVIEHLSPQGKEFREKHPLMRESIDSLAEVVSLSQVMSGPNVLHLGDVTVHAGLDIVMNVMSAVTHAYSRYVHHYCSCGKSYYDLFRFRYQEKRINVFTIRNEEFKKLCNNGEFRIENKKYVGKGVREDLLEVGHIYHDGIMTYSGKYPMLRHWDSLLFSVEADLWALLDKLSRICFHSRCRRKGPFEFCNAFFVKRELRIQKYLELGKT